MGVVLPFTPRTSRRPSIDSTRSSDPPGVEQAVLSAVERGGNHYEVLDAATELLALCRDRYGFTVMQNGLPREPNALADALVTLLRGLTLIERGATARVLEEVRVYFGGSDMGWVGGGADNCAALILPVGAKPSTLAEFVRLRLGTSAS